MKVKIVMLPRGKWRMEIGNQWSDKADYSERIIWEFAGPWGMGLVGQTEYWGEEKVWGIDKVVPSESEDKSLE